MKNLRHPHEQPGRVNLLAVVGTALITSVVVGGGVYASQAGLLGENQKSLLSFGQNIDDVYGVESSIEAMSEFNTFHHDGLSVKFLYPTDFATTVVQTGPEHLVHFQKNASSFFSLRVTETSDPTYAQDYWNGDISETSLGGQPAQEFFSDGPNITTCSPPTCSQITLSKMKTIEGHIYQAIRVYHNGRVYLLDMQGLSPYEHEMILTEFTFL